MAKIIVNKTSITAIFLNETRESLCLVYQGFLYLHVNHIYKIRICFSFKYYP